MEWEKTWLGIRSPPDGLRKAWEGDRQRRQLPTLPHNDSWGIWRDVLEAQFESEDGIRRLFDDSPCRELDELVKALKQELVALAQYCDESLRRESS